jgi:hypothetical protein
LLLPTLGLVAVLVLAARPIAAFASTLRTDLARGERAFIGWMAPRGIVAAATASRRYQHGEQIVAQPGSSALPAGHDALFLVRADRKLAAVTESSRPAPQTGDTIVSLGPPPAARRLDTDAGIAATRDIPEPGVERR